METPLEVVLLTELTVLTVDTQVLSEFVRAVLKDDSAPLLTVALAVAASAFDAN